MIAGIGIDVVDIVRFQRSVERTPALLERLFAESERNRPARSLAARARDAVIDLTGTPWTDVYLAMIEGP